MLYPPNTSNHTTNDRFAMARAPTCTFKTLLPVKMEKMPVCVLLFKNWVLDTRAKFDFAYVGDILLGIATKGLLCIRKKIFAETSLTII